MDVYYIHRALVAGAAIILSTTAEAALVGTRHPYDYMLHGSVGAGVAYLASAHIHPMVGIALAGLIGVAKERSDLNYDPKDAFATLAGGLAGALMSGPIIKNPKYGSVIVTPTAVFYRLQFH